MKKLFAFLLTLTLLTASAGAVDLYIDTDLIETDTPPMIVDGRTLVPLRAIFEALDATVTWDQATQTATGIKDEVTVVLQIDNTTAYVNGEAHTLDVPAQLINSRTMVPARFISEALGCNVSWDQTTQTVGIANELRDRHIYVTETGKKYHYSDTCNGGTYYEATLAEAMGRGLTPCEKCALVIADASTGTAVAGNYVTNVIRVVDGDTIVVNYNGAEEKVRLIGIDTPESVHPDSSKNTESGIAASAYTKSKLEGKTVELEFDVQQRDVYGRLLAYVYVDGVMFNKTLLEDGIANLATYPPNVKHVDEFTAIVAARTGAPAATKPEPAEPEMTTVTPEESGVSEPSWNSTVKKSGTYVGSIQSDKYHNPSCRYAKVIAPENEIWFDTVSEAQAAGYSACGVCHPS